MLLRRRVRPLSRVHAMPRKAKPWKRRGIYVSKIAGKLTPLGKTEGEAAVELRRLTGSTSPATFAELVARYLRHVDQRARDGELSPVTARGYRDHLAAALVVFGSRPACDLRGVDVLDWLASRPDLSVSTRAAYSRVTHRALRWGAAVGLLDRDPLAGCPLPSFQARARYVTADDAAAVMAAIATPRLRTLFRFLWLTGCRIGEAVRIEAADCDLKAGVVTLAQHKTARKTGRPREIPLCPEAITILDRAVQDFPAGPVLRNRCRRAWNPRHVAKVFKQVAARTGCPHVTPHQLRSLWATDAIAAGVPVPVVADCLGHSPNVLLRHYSRTRERLDLMTAAARRVREAG
jgi:integrase